jgi:hypothetical protein
MKDIYKEPVLYYAAVPVFFALWPLLIWAVYLPGAKEDLRLEAAEYAKAQKLMAEIMTIDPTRVEFSDSDTKAAEFDYGVVVEKVAGACGIHSANYKLSSGIIITSGGQKTQSAKVVLKQVDITRFARFVSLIQLRWANLQCTQIKLTKAKALPDTWDADLDFKYYY